jgi:NAD+ synthase (glutamine-hydrolysing)
MPDPEQRFSGLLVRRTVVSTEPVPAYEVRVSEPAERLDDLAETYAAITLGLRDYVRKNGFRSVLFGLSGGIDSSLVAAIAVDALGADYVYRRLEPVGLVQRALEVRRSGTRRRTGISLTTVRSPGSSTRSRPACRLTVWPRRTCRHGSAR